MKTSPSPSKYSAALFLVTLLVAASLKGLGQCTFGTANCTSSMSNGTSTNFNALTWTHVSGPACPTGVSSGYTGNLSLSMANNTNLTVSANFTLTGDFKVTN